MLFPYHILAASAIGLVAWLLLKDQAKYFSPYVVLAQFMDVDHYNGNLWQMVRCVFFTDKQAFMDACMPMVRGIFHQYIPFWWTILFASVVFCEKEKHRLVFLGLLVGYSLHIYMDFFVLQ
jgi:hypothetical protein